MGGIGVLMGPWGGITHPSNSWLVRYDGPYLNSRLAHVRVGNANLKDYAAGEIPASTVDVGDRTASPDDTFDGRIFTAPAPADPRTPDEIAIDAILDKTDADITDPEVKQLTILQARQMRGVRS